MSVEIRRPALEAIAGHAIRDAPVECCGLLVGTARRVERAVPARNLHASPTRYLIDPADHFAAIRTARSEGLEVMGAYHSHPGAPPVPSATDVAEAYDRYYLYVIVSPGAGTQAPDIRAFRLADAGFEPVELVPVEAE